jgi:hypothetical protein
MSRIEKKEQKKLDNLQKKKKKRWGDSLLNDGEEKIINIIHLVKKNLQCQGVLSLARFPLAFLENIHHENILELF